MGRVIDTIILMEAIYASIVFTKFGKTPLSLYHQALFFIIRSNMDVGAKNIPSEIRENLKEWKAVYPLELLTKNKHSSPIPIFFELAIEMTKYNNAAEINTAQLGNIYDSIGNSVNKRFRVLRYYNRSNFTKTLAIAIGYRRVVQFIKKLPFRTSYADSCPELSFGIIRKACQTGSYPVVLYWVKIMTLNVSGEGLNSSLQNSILQNSILQDVLAAYSKSNADKQLKSICQLLEVAYGLDIIKNQMIVAARQDNLQIIKSICLQQGNYIGRSIELNSWGEKFVSLDTYKNIFNRSDNLKISNVADIVDRLRYNDPCKLKLYNDVCLAACNAGSISVIKHIVPILSDTWKNNRSYAARVAGTGKMPALEYFLQRKHVIAQLIHGAITTASIRSFGFLLLVMVKELSKVSGLISTFGKRVANICIKCEIKCEIYSNYYIILRYLTITKLNLGMEVNSELQAAAILYDTQLIEYIKSRTQEMNPKTGKELNEKIGFCHDQSWVDQFDSVNTVRRAAFEMLLESIHYTKIGITRLIKARENGLPLIDLKWALGRSIETKNIEIEKAIRLELNPPPLILTKSIHPRKRSISSTKTKGKKTIPNGQPKKKKIKLPL